MLKTKWNVKRAVGWGAAIGALWMAFGSSIGNVGFHIQYVFGGAVGGAVLFGLVAVVRNLTVRLISPR
jgi:hypothetical protein